jgi:3-oxoacyl-[acyl-carrier-protein] synthase-3
MPYLHSFGCALPAERVGNEALAARTGMGATEIAEKTGIRERRYAAEGVTVADLGLAAASDCLANAGLSVQDVGLILFATGTGEQSFPGPASELAAKLGLTSTPAIDLPIASAGSLAGIALANDLVPRYGNVLVVASEIMSRRISDADPDTAVLFGDGAGACLVSRDQGFARIVDFALYTDGNSAGSLYLPSCGTLQMNGLAVILHASRKLPRAVGDLLNAHGLSPMDVGVYLMHQANANLLRKVASTLKVPEERFFSNIECYGNTSSASLLIAAAEWRSSGASPAAGPVVLAAFGAGFHWGVVLAEQVL